MSNIKLEVRREMEEKTVMKRLALITLSALTATTVGASASSGYGSGSRYGYYNNGSDDRAESIARRRQRQHQAIYRANAAGELTRRERERLFAEQNGIIRNERAAHRNGYVSRSEARRIGESQNAARRHIRNESTDGQYRW